jgi:hypothetical protein
MDGIEVQFIPSVGAEQEPTKLLLSGMNLMSWLNGLKWRETWVFML